MEGIQIFLNSVPGAVALGLIWAIMAIGVYVTYKILDIADLTVDGSIGTGGAVCAILIVSEVNIWLAMLIAVLAGALTGLITAVFHLYFGIPAILAGILTQLMLYSINLKILGKANLSVSARQYDVLVSQLNVGVAVAILAGVVIVLIGLLYWFFGTEIGSATRATGCNIKMSRAQGINTNLTIIIGLMLSNAIVALAGALLAQYQGFADVNMGRGAIVIGLAAVIIGSAIIGFFKKINSNFAGKLFGVAIGGVVYYLVYQLVITLGIDTDLLKMLSAIVVALFLAVPFWKKKLSAMKGAK